MPLTVTEPMDIDPIDDGPLPTPRNNPSSLVMSAPRDALNISSTVISGDDTKQMVDMLRSDDLSSRVAAANKLDSIALALGQQRTREELLPFITDGIDDEDEVLLAVANALGRMVDSVGGPEYAKLLLQPLELLLSIEELSVREAASESALAIAEQLPEASFKVEYAEMITRLATKEWFTARISAAGILCSAYPRLKSDQKLQHEHLLLFSQLCRDDTPMVRRIAAQYLGKMVKRVVGSLGRESLAPNGIVVELLIPLFEDLASTDQPDSVRLRTTENCVAFGEVMSEIRKTGPLFQTEIDLLRRIVPLIVATIDDRSWRVRWTAAAKYADVVAAYDELPESMDALVPAYEKLLQDPEAEVRTAATFNLAHVAKCKAKVPTLPSSQSRPSTLDSIEQSEALGGPRISVAERLVKRVTSLTEDDSEHVRAALAMVATGLAPVLGKDATITYLVPPVLLLLRDAASEVRLNLISSLSALNEVIGVDLLSQSLLPAILDLAQDGKWRIRLAIIQHIPLLAKQLGREFFTEKLSSLCVGWLGDDIASIRRAAAWNLKELTALFGAEWAVENLIPSIVEIQQHKSYLRRLTALQACGLMATEMGLESATVDVLPLILEMATDSVANIRFNVAKELNRVALVCNMSTYHSQIVPVLTMLKDDDDLDVCHYAEQTSSALELVFLSASK